MLHLHLAPAAACRRAESSHEQRSAGSVRARALLPSVRAMPHRSANTVADVKRKAVARRVIASAGGGQTQDEASLLVEDTKQLTGESGIHSAFWSRQLFLSEFVGLIFHLLSPSAEKLKKYGVPLCADLLSSIEM